MSSDIILAVLSGSFAILAAIIACCQQYKINRDSIKNQSKKERKERKLENKKLLQKYKDPLLQASRELYFFIENLFRKNMTILDSNIKKKTFIYLFAKFLCWKEIIRENLIIMDDIESKFFFNLRNNLTYIQKQFDTEHISNTKFKLSSSEQRAIGEIMTNNNKCINYTNFILNYDNYKKWFTNLENDVNELSTTLLSLKPCIPDKIKPITSYNKLDLHIFNEFLDPHEWVSKNYFDNPNNNICLRCNEPLNKGKHTESNISIYYIRLLNIKNSLNKLIRSEDNNNEYYIGIEPLWNHKLTKTYKNNLKKEICKKKYGYFWYGFYYLNYKITYEYCIRYFILLNQNNQSSNYITENSFNYITENSSNSNDNSNDNSSSFNSSSSNIILEPIYINNISN